MSGKAFANNQGDVDPGSKRIFSSVHDLTEDILSTTAMLVGVR
jgi:hypothetical protein